MTIWISTNGRKSNGAKELSNQPDFKRCIKGNGIKVTDVLVNWGSSQPLDYLVKAKKYLNKPDKVLYATNKLLAFSQLKMAGVSIVEFTTDREVAQVWADQGHVVVVRGKLTGHSGDGIIIIDKLGQVPNGHPLYTKYIFKEREYRVHVMGDQVIDTQRKIKDPDREVTDWKVRSYDNGFLYARNGIVDDDNRSSLAVEATKALGLDFGAVDLIQDKAGIYYVLEVNSAPGLEGKTVESYAAAFRASAANG